MKEQETKKKEKVVKKNPIKAFGVYAVIIAALAGLISAFVASIEHSYKRGVGHGRAECGELKGVRTDLETKTKDYDTLQKEYTKLGARIALLEDSIQGFKDKEKKTNDANIANSIFKKQKEDLIKQGNKLLIDYKEQTNMVYKFGTWKSNVIGILNNKDKEIAKKIDNIESKYSPGDYYSQIKDIINLLNNF